MIKGFTVLREEQVPFYNGKATYLKHDRTGMKIFYFKPEKNNDNYFSYIFKTPISDDTGIAHCLEHMVLQGSEKFPVKNAYFHMTQKALTNQINATTEQYRTRFYARSYIPEDYYRLLDFYGDTVFFPLLDEKAFKQEVWRFDLDENSQPFINGVVFNEMSASKKILSYNQEKYCTKKLFQGSESEYNSGGDFLNIPELSIEKLKAFHKKYYTPANCLLYLFGKLDLDEQLSFLEEKLLNRLPAGTEETQILDEIIPLPSMSELKIDVPHKGLDESFVELNILCKDGAREDKIQRNFFFERIEELIQKQLKYSDIGKVYTEQLTSPHHKYLIIGFMNVKKSEIENAKKLLVSSLEHCLDGGMDYEELQAECRDKDLFYTKSNKIVSYKELQNKISSGWIKANNPFDNIFPEEEWNCLKSKILSYDDEKFKSMLNEYLLNNPNKVFVIKTPAKDYFEKIEAERKSLIEKKLQEYGKTTEEIAIEKSMFEDYFKTDDSELLKKLFPPLKIKSLKDIDDPGIDNIEQIDGKTGPIFLFSSTQETDGKVKFKINFAIDNLSQEEFQQLPWMRKFINCFGFDGLNTSETETLLKEKGINGFFFGNNYEGSDLGGKQIYENRYWVTSGFSCYKENFEECLNIYYNFLYKKNFGDCQERKIAKENLSKLFAKINFSDAEILASKYVDSYFSEQEKFDNENTGINSLCIREQNKNQDIDSLVVYYQKLYEKIISGSAIINIFGDEENIEKCKDAVKRFVKRIEIKSLQENKLKHLNEKININGTKISTIITQVSSGSLVLKFWGSEYPSKEYVVEQTLLHWFNRNILFEQLRKLHGAYSCICGISENKNIVHIQTTRDPAPDKALKIIIENCLKKLAELDELDELTEEYVKEIALKEYSTNLFDLDPILKGDISYSRRLEGKTPEMKQTCLKYILEITRKDFIEAGKRLYENSKNLKACIVTGDKKQVCGEVICDMTKL